MLTLNRSMGSDRCHCVTRTMCASDSATNVRARRMTVPFFNWETFSTLCVVNAALQDGATPLHIASLDGHLELVRLLLSHGANKEAALEVRAMQLP